MSYTKAYTVMPIETASQRLYKYNLKLVPLLEKQDIQRCTIVHPKIVPLLQVINKSRSNMLNLEIVPLLKLFTRLFATVLKIFTYPRSKKGLCRCLRTNYDIGMLVALEGIGILSVTTPSA